MQVPVDSMDLHLLGVLNSFFRAHERLQQHHGRPPGEHLRLESLLECFERTSFDGVARSIRGEVAVTIDMRVNHECPM